MEKEIELVFNENDYNNEQIKIIEKANKSNIDLTGYDPKIFDAKSLEKILKELLNGVE